MVTLCLLFGAVLFTVHVHFCCLIGALLGRQVFLPTFTEKRGQPRKVTLALGLASREGGSGILSADFFFFFFSN